MGGGISEKIGCIEIGDNVFIGTNSTVLYNVKIGSNVIIGAGSLVNKSIPNNSVACGVPAKVIGSFDKFFEKRKNEIAYPSQFKVINESISDDFIEWLWADFEKKTK